MKRVLLFLFVLSISTGLFTACSSDNDLAGSKIPQGEIFGDNVIINLNGELLSSGAVQMTSPDGLEGVLSLKNIVSGFDTIPVPVQLTSQAGETYTFVGKTEVCDTSSEIKKDATVDVEVFGTISSDGKVAVAVKAYGQGLFVGIYSGNKLNLTYSDSVMAGKGVWGYVNNSKPEIALMRIVPGEVATILPDIDLLDDNSFSGETTTSTSAKIKYNGNVNAATGVMTLNLQVELSSAAQGGLTGTWPLNTSGPLKMVWSPLDKSKKNGEEIASVVSVLGSQFVAEFLNEITLRPDGNAIIKFYPKVMTGVNADGTDKSVLAWLLEKLRNQTIQPLPREWRSSRLNSVQWYAKDGYIYLQPNVLQVLKGFNESGKTNLDLNTIANIINNLDTMDDATLKTSINVLESFSSIDLSSLDISLVRQVLSWTITGIPLKYTKTDSNLVLYADKEMVAPFMPLVLSFTPLLQKLYDTKVDEDESGILKYVPFMLGISKFSDINDIWNDNTDQFEIDLNFKQ